MMTSEEIRETIEQLRKMTHECGTYTVRTPALRDRLIELLEQADPDTHVGLPKDADGLTWHVGDAVEDGTVIKEIMLTKYGWNLIGVPAIDPSIHRHYRKTTIEDVLREYADEVRRCCDTEDTIAEYATRLREVMADE